MKYLLLILGSELVAIGLYAVISACVMIFFPNTPKIEYYGELQNFKISPYAKTEEEIKEEKNG